MDCAFPEICTEENLADSFIQSDVHKCFKISTNKHILAWLQRGFTKVTDLFLQENNDQVLTVHLMTVT